MCPVGNVPRNTVTKTYQHLNFFQHEYPGLGDEAATA